MFYCYLNTKVLMKVHTSNYRIAGFSEEMTLDRYCRK
ncbi:hypothetical protein [Peptostreptococcus russellii]